MSEKQLVIKTIKVFVLWPLYWFKAIFDEFL